MGKGETILLNRWECRTGVTWQRGGRRKPRETLRKREEKKKGGDRNRGDEFSLIENLKRGGKGERIGSPEPR